MSGQSNDGSVQEPPFHKMGLLTKLGGNVKNWLQRGFALRRDTQQLFYFRSAEHFRVYVEDASKHKGKVAGIIPLANARMYVADYVHEFYHALELTSVLHNTRVQRHFYLCAKTERDLHAWVRALSEAGVQLVCPRADAAVLKHVSRGVFGIQGFLSKRGRFNKSFKRRFCRVERDDKHIQSLAYYEWYDSTKPKGRVCLKDASLVDDLSDAEASEDVLFGVQSPQRLFIFQCDSAEQRARWLGVLHVVMQDPTKEAPNLPQVMQEEEDVGGTADCQDDDDGVGFAMQMELEINDGGGISDETNSGMRARRPPVSIVSDSDDDEEQEHDARGHEHSPGPAIEALPAEARLDPHPTVGSIPNDVGAATAAAARLAEQQQLDAAEQERMEAQRREQELQRQKAEEQECQRLLELQRQREAEERQRLLELQRREQEEDELRERERQAKAAAEAAFANSVASLEQGLYPVVKYGRRGKPHEKFVYLSEGKKLAWNDADGMKSNKDKHIDLSCTSVFQVIRGKKTVVFKRSCADEAPHECCLSIVVDERSLDVCFASQEDRDLWHDTIVEVHRRLVG